MARRLSFLPSGENMFWLIFGHRGAGPCRQENPNVVRAYNKYKDKNFTIIGVSLDKADGKAAWQSAIKNDGLNWTQVSDLKFWNNDVAKAYFINAIPANFLLDPNR